MQSEELKVPEDFVPTKRSCLRCGHMKVCKIFPVVSKYLEEDFEKADLEPPFKPEAIANLCSYYLPISPANPPFAK